VGTAAITDLRKKTTITSTGVKGVRLRVPADVSLPANSDDTLWSLTLSRGTYAFAAIGLSGGDCSQPDDLPDDWYETCMDVALWRVPGLTQFGGSMADPLSWKANTNLDVYLFTDGAATFTMNLPSPLTRSTSLVANQRARARVDLIPTQGCATEDCALARWGGVAHRVSHGYVNSMRYFIHSSPRVVDALEFRASDIEPRYQALCNYPHAFLSPEVSPDPDDHPYGCDLAGSEDSPSIETGQDIVHSYAFQDNYGRRMIMNYWADGLSYVGHFDGAKSVTTTPLMRTYGVWITPGIG